MTTTCLFDEDFIETLKALSPAERGALVARFWPDPKFSPQSFDDFASAAFLANIIGKLSHVRRHRDLFAVQDFEGIFAIIRTLREQPSKSYNDIVCSISSQLYLNMAPESIRRSVELSTRIWLTFNTHSADVSIGTIDASESGINWAMNQTLEQLIVSQLAERRTLQKPGKGVRIDAAITAAYLVNTCGLTLQWSNNFVDHLRFDPEHLVLTVYRHKACLISHLDSNTNCPIPRDLLEEMLDTLNLLFPFGDSATRSMLWKEGQQSLYTLGNRGRRTQTDASYYQYFGADLTQLIEAFSGTPRTWRQLALDRRNKLEWSAFWVTVMVAILTLVSIPCNIIQATYSVKAYQATIAQAKVISKNELS